MKDWHDFYLLTGTAAATLIGLMFVALSFGVGLRHARSTERVHMFVTPTVVYFADVLVIAAASVAPLPGTRWLALVLAGMVLMNVAPGVRRVWQLGGVHKESGLEGRAWLWQVLLPAASQAAVLVSAYGFFRGDDRAPFVLATAILILMVVGVRNAWFLVIWLLEQRAQ